jgi:hypothetical protein
MEHTLQIQSNENLCLSNKFFPRKTMVFMIMMVMLITIEDNYTHNNDGDDDN